MEANPYKPIDCSIYDFFEEAATLKRSSKFEIEEGSDIKMVEGIITDLYIREKAEYMLLASGQSYRLDKVISINGIDTRNRSC